MYSMLQLTDTFHFIELIIPIIDSLFKIIDTPYTQTTVHLNATISNQFYLVPNDSFRSSFSSITGFDFTFYPQLYDNNTK